MSSFKCNTCGKLLNISQGDPGDMFHCPDCGQKIQLVPNNAVVKRTEYGIESVVDSLAAEFKKDIDYLLSLGIKLDKGSETAKAGGLAWAGYEGFTGDWLSALVIGGLSLLVGGLANGYKKIKVQEIQKKWFDILSELDEQQLGILMEALQRRYPVLTSRIAGLLGP